jgi:ribonuclease J
MKKRHVSSENELVFLPLGGCAEIGMNLNAYGYGSPEDRRWIIVDIGVTFGDDSTPGIDVILPDPAFLEGEAKSVEAIILTHAHEDHIGAIGHLWPRFRCPIYATPFTAALVKDKLKERGLGPDVPLHVVPMKAKLQVGPFEIEYITLTHSIPEPNGLAITTPLGTILHTGDWKIDPEPMIGEGFDYQTVERLGNSGILAMVCDSTNVFVEGESGSEGEVRLELERVLREQTGAVAVTGFASNVARLESIMLAAEACGRSVVLAGRSMHRIVGAARSVGLLANVNPPIDDADAGRIPRENVLYLCTGSQGEPKAALARIAKGEHPHVRLSEGDSVIFSSRVIPGNERAIHEIMNLLADKGVELITAPRRHVHVSGHPCRDELRRMYAWARPQIAVPVHGERRHILEHARFARSLQIPTALAPRNGDLIRLAPGQPIVVDEVPYGRLMLDGERLVPDGSAALAERKRMAWNGLIAVSLAVDDKSKLKDGPIAVLRGLAAANGAPTDADIDKVETAAEQAFGRLAAKDRQDDDLIEKAIERAVKRVADTLYRKRPLIDVTVLRV